MKILTGTEVLAPDGGIEVCVAEDTQALADRGHRVDVLFTRDGVQREALTAAGVRLHVPERFVFDPRHAVRDLVSFVRSAGRVRRLGVDVLWLNRPETVVWAQVVSRLAGVPLVVHLHHAPNYRLEKLMMLGVPRFIAVSAHMKQVWAATGIPADRIEVVSNAVPATKYTVATPIERGEARRRLGVPEGARAVVFYGRVTRDKGILTVLGAWQTLALEPARAVLVIAGDQPVDAEVASALDALPEGSIIRLPHRDDVADLLHAADIVVAPSWQPESFGRTVVEALSAGVPAIGADHGGTAEVLDGELTRFAVPPRDAVALADRIAGLLDWRDSEPELGRVVSANVARRYSSDAHVDDVAAILLSAVKSSRRSGRSRRFGRFRRSRDAADRPDAAPVHRSTTETSVTAR